MPKGLYACILQGTVLHHTEYGHTLHYELGSIRNGLASRYAIGAAMLRSNAMALLSYPESTTDIASMATSWAMVSSTCVTTV